jgi:hypothetical protein
MTTADPPEFCPDSEVSPHLYNATTANVVACHGMELLRRHMLRRELAALRQQWMREARIEALRLAAEIARPYDDGIASMLVARAEKEEEP